MEYENLLLSSGGVIFSDIQQAAQVPDAAHIFIGLGGTGIDLLTAIKKEVKKRIKPDNLTDGIPTYKRIQFLGVDFDKNMERKIGKNNSCYIFTREPKDFDWIKTHTFNYFCRCNFGKQNCRLLFMKFANFLEMLNSKIKTAKEGFKENNNTKLHIHIFTGSAGSTGSGIFFDVCYLIRDLANTIGISSCSGYVFMPDVNLTKRLDSFSIDLIKEMGYATLQELDYCMSLDYNGGKFSQEYPDGKLVEWSQPPVDICHLISAANLSFDTVHGAYNYAQSVVTEYIINCLTKDGFLMNYIDKFRMSVNLSANRQLRGMNLRYSTLGGASCVLPRTEINTYLVSRLFEKFVKKTSENTPIMPCEADINQLAIDTLAPTADSIANIYSKLFDEITSDAAGIQFKAYDGSYKDLLSNNNEAFINWYLTQEDTKINALKKNIENLIKGNDSSLIEKIKKALKKIICGDGDKAAPKGPKFAYQMLFEGSEFNLDNIIVSLIVENEQRLLLKQRQLNELRGYYEESENSFINRRKRSFFDNDKKRFNDYENDMMNYENAKYSIEVYKRTANLLDTLEKQVKEEKDKFFAIFKRIMDNLHSTFEINISYLEDSFYPDNSFYTPIISIDELKPAMDAAVDALDLNKVFGSFFNMFFDHEKQWIDENEEKISKLVTDFFIGTVFKDFANKGINDFLADKYKTADTDMLSHYIYDDCITDMENKAKLLFPFDTVLAQPENLGYIKHISVPALSVPIQDAAKKYTQTDSSCKVHLSDFCDGIYMFNSAFAFPIASYAPAIDYEQLYSKCIYIYGRHSYEFDKWITPINTDMIFNDWRKLPPLRPQSVIDINSPIPEEMKELLTRARTLYQAGKDKGFIDEDEKIYSFNEKEISDLEQKISKAEKLLEDLNKNTTEELKKLLIEIENKKNIKPHATEYQICKRGAQDLESQNRIVLDYFTFSPVLNIMVEKALSNQCKLDELHERAIKLDIG